MAMIKRIREAQNMLFLLGLIIFSILSVSELFWAGLRILTIPVFFIGCFYYLAVLFGSNEEK
jgi:hypothetical protein